jgi:hypothetical protein
MPQRCTGRREFQQFLREYADQTVEYRRQNCHFFVGFRTLARLEESVDVEEIEEILRGPVREEIGPGEMTVFHREAIVEAVQAFVERFGGSPSDPETYAALWQRLSVMADVA